MVSDVESPREGMRPRMFVWAASLALVIGGVVAVAPRQHDAVAGASVSGPTGKASSLVSDSHVPRASLSAPVDRASASPLASLVSDLVERSAKAHNPSSAAVARLASLIVKRSAPVHLSIPAIGVSVGLTELGLLANGSPQVPSSWYVPGWYKYGPAPGQLGSAVILGHVDSVAGPAVFYRLVDLKVGNRVIVKLKDGKTVYFSVTALREYSKKKFPDKFVYGSRPYGALQLVTCGGAFDSQTHHYLSSIVVFTKQVKG
jgi:hypothetical protein